MFKLKYNQKLGLIISFTTSLVILLSFGVFILLFYLTSISQIRSSLVLEANEVIENYVVFQDNKLTLKNIEDLNRDTLRDRLSLSVYSNDLTLVNSFGLFSQKSPEKLFADETLFFSKLNDVVSSKKSSFNSLSQKNESNSYELVITPLMNSGNVIGVIVIVSPVETVNKVLDSSKYLIALILPFSFILLYILGQKLGITAFKPLRNLIENIKEVDHSNLDIQIESEGHPDDETTLLSSEFNSMIERLNEAFIKQKKFISNSSHELRTPLTRLQTGIGILKGNEDLKNELSEEINSMSSTLTRLSLLAKLEKDKRDIKVVNLRDFVKSLNLDSRVKNKLDKNFTIRIDTTDLNIILDNLISNSIKYSKKEIVIGNANNYFYVKDFGIGIPTEEMRNISNPFFRSKNAIRSGIEGIGLGLSIVKEICDIYKFKLEIVSKKGMGSEFRIIDLNK